MEARPDGTRERGWFRTFWGVEELEVEWRNGHRVYEGDIALDPGSEVPPPVEGEARQAILSATSRAWAMDPSGVVTIPYEIDNTGGLDSALFGRTESNIQRAMLDWETFATRPGVSGTPGDRR